MQIRIEVCECDVCGHRWLASAGRPKRCAKCKSARWNVESATEHELVELPSVALLDRRHLPAHPGLYFVLAEGQLQYIGLARQLDLRWGNHERLPALRKMENVRIAWIAIPGVDLESLTELESVLISIFEPPMNGGPLKIIQGAKRRIGLSLSSDVLAILNEHGRSEMAGMLDDRPTRTQIIEEAVRLYAKEHEANGGAVEGNVKSEPSPDPEYKERVRSDRWVIMCRSCQLNVHSSHLMDGTCGNLNSEQTACACLVRTPPEAALESNWQKATAENTCVDCGVKFKDHDTACATDACPDCGLVSVHRVRCPRYVKPDAEQAVQSPAACLTNGGRGFDDSIPPTLGAAGAEQAVKDAPKQDAIDTAWEGSPALPTEEQKAARRIYEEANKIARLASEERSSKKARGKRKAELGESVKGALPARVAFPKPSKRGGK